MKQAEFRPANDSDMLPRYLGHLAEIRTDVTRWPVRIAMSGKRLARSRRKVAEAYSRLKPILQP